MSNHRDSTSQIVAENDRRCIAAHRFWGEETKVGWLQPWLGGNSTRIGYIYIYIFDMYIYIYIYIYTYIYMYTYIYIYIYISISLKIHIHIHITDTYTYIYIYICISIYRYTSIYWNMIRWPQLAVRESWDSLIFRFGIPLWFAATIYSTKNTGT